MSADQPDLLLSPDPQEQDAPSPWQRVRRLLGWVVALLICAVGILTLVPDALAGLSELLRLSSRYPFAQLVALRSVLAVALAVLGLIVTVAAAVRSVRREGGSRTSVVGLVLLLVAGLHGWTLYDRGLGADATITGVVRSEASAWDGSLAVYSFNTYKSQASLVDLAVSIRQAGADVIVLPETDAAYGVRLADLLAQDGYDLTVFSSLDTQATGRRAQDTVSADGLGTDTVATTVLVSSALGAYEQEDRPQGLGQGSLVVAPVGEAALNGHQRPVIVGVHTVAPVGETWMADWEQSVSAAVAQCPGAGGATLVAGDFNATLDHAPMKDLGRCVDASATTGTGGLSTWPTSSRTTLLGATIDHVLVDSQAWLPQSSQVLEVKGSDHRAVVTVLGPAR